MYMKVAHIPLPLWKAILSFYNCRGDDFREDFARLGESRSLIPKHVHVMALTATATKPTRKAVIRRLNMHKPVIIPVQAASIIPRF